MSSTSTVNYLDIKARLLGVAGITITNEVFLKYRDFICYMFYCLNLDYKALPELLSTDGNPISIGAEERRSR